MTTKVDRSPASQEPDRSTGQSQPAAAQAVTNGLQSALERALIEEYLAGRGHTLRSLDALPPEERDAMLRAATTSATLKLAEIEARAHLLDSMA